MLKDIINELKKENFHVLATTVTNVLHDKQLKNKSLDSVYDLWLSGNGFDTDDFFDALLMWQQVNRYPNHVVEHSLVSLIHENLLDKDLLTRWKENTRE